MTILAAEDDPLILMTIEAYFTREGYQVITTSNGRDALRRIRMLPRHYYYRCYDAFLFGA
jgi:DNA-binding response OmpR family regulator